MPFRRSINVERKSLAWRLLFREVWNDDSFERSIDGAGLLKTRLCRNQWKIGPHT